MKTFPLPLIASLLAGTLAAPTQAAEPRLPNDGWVSWEVPAVEGAPFWCCWSNWDKDVANRATCDLDEGSRHHRERDDATTDAIRVYAHSSGGKIDRLQAYAAACPVKSATPIQPLVDVETDDSARWLSAHVKQGDLGKSSRHSIADDAIAALALHRGDVAQVELTRFARDDPRAETRKRAVFWLALMRGEEGVEVARALMFDDQDAEVRKHAAFAMSRTQSPQATPELIRQGNTDEVGDVRAQAWFWLAQTEAAGAEQAITAALRKDPDDSVREHAVFALSLLPGGRSSKALIAAAEDQSLSRELRKRAVFWLSQSESEEAQAYLEKVLARTAAK